jgi:hypothetical protein
MELRFCDALPHAAERTRVNHPYALGRGGFRRHICLNIISKEEEPPP